MDKALNYLNTFNNNDLRDRAFIHRSYLNESKTATHSNERLEFLGDAVLELIVSDHLFSRFDSFHEGKLTVIRSSIVRTETLADAAKKLNLGSHLKLSKGEEENNGRNNPSILANTYEAFLGALYLDQGFDAANDFVHKTLIPLIPDILEKKQYVDAKSKFQEEIQEREKVTPTYKVLNESGPDHMKKFVVGVFVNNKQYGKGIGKSKQEAEAKAAEEGINSLNE